MADDLWELLKMLLWVIALLFIILIALGYANTTACDNDPNCNNFITTIRDDANGIICYRDELNLSLSCVKIDKPEKAEE